MLPLYGKRMHIWVNFVSTNLCKRDGKIYKKTTIIGSRLNSKLLLQGTCKRLGLKTKFGLAAKDLGLGRAGGLRRTMVGIKDRFRKAKLRTGRVAYLAKNSKQARNCMALGFSQATYGAEGVGYTPTMISQLHTMAADCMGYAKVGRCPMTAIAITKDLEWNPDVRGPTNLILEWCKLALPVAPLAMCSSMVGHGTAHCRR